MGSTASFVFFFLFLHVVRAMFYGSYFYNPKTWFSGILLFLIINGYTFMGYVLPFGQMSFWGATVITNLLSPFPSLIEWVCGGYCVHCPTLKRFFLIHFPDPFELTFANTLLLSNAAVCLGGAFVSLELSLEFFTFFSLFSFIHAWTFISLQIKEFQIMGLSINDSVYSCVFFFLTGLHFFHLLFWSCSFSFQIFSSWKTTKAYPKLIEKYSEINWCWMDFSFQCSSIMCIFPFFY